MVNHAARDQINRRKGSVESNVKGRDMDLGKVHVDFLGAMDASDPLSINDGKLQLRSEQLVDAAVCGASIDQGREVDYR